MLHSRNTPIWVFMTIFRSIASMNYRAFIRSHWFPTPFMLAL
jgi:hypothetical protein